MLLSCGHFLGLQLDHLRSWHPAFIRPVGGRGRGPASGSLVTGLVPHATLGGRENGGKKPLHLRHRRSSLAPFMTAGVPGKNDSEKPDPTSPYGPASQVYESHARRMGPEARPPAPEAVQGTGSPQPCKEERGGKNLLKRAIPGI